MCCVVHICGKTHKVCLWGCSYDAFMTGAVFACLLPLLAAADDPEVAAPEAAAPEPDLPLLPKPTLALGPRSAPAHQTNEAAAANGATVMEVESLEDREGLDAAAELARGVAAGEAAALEQLAEARRRIRETPPAAPSWQTVEVHTLSINRLVICSAYTSTHDPPARGITGPQSRTRTRPRLLF